MLLYIHYTWFGGVASKVMILLNADDLLQMRCKEVGPIIGWNYCVSFFITNKLREVAFSGVIDHLSNGSQTPDLGTAIVALKKPKTPVWSKFRVADNKKG